MGFHVQISHNDDEDEGLVMHDIFGPTAVSTKTYVLLLSRAQFLENQKETYESSTPNLHQTDITYNLKNKGFLQKCTLCWKMSK